MNFKIMSLFFLIFSSSAFSQSYFCDYTDMEGNSGVVSINLNNDKLTAKLNRRTYSANKCLVDRTFSSEVLVTCDENSGRGMGFMLSDARGREEGYLIVEKLSLFAELICR